MFKFIADFLQWCDEQDLVEGDRHLITQEEWEEDQKALHEHLQRVEDRYYVEVAKRLSK